VIRPVLFFFISEKGISMSLTVDVDEHQPRKVEWELSMTVVLAVTRAFSGSHLRLRPRTVRDQVLVNGNISSYNHILSRDEADADIEITSDGFEAFRAQKAKRQKFFQGAGTGSSARSIP
jgi:hypothetical protein